MSFGARLAEERKRLGLKQAEFAALVGTDVPKQSLYENDRRELRADYLARLADAQIDVIYVLTGHRMEGGRLSEQATRLLSAYLCLPEPTQRSLADFIETMRSDFDHGAPRTVHGKSLDFRPEPGLR
jgi:transcriptional regulator with XRE-family HTH domain